MATIALDAGRVVLKDGKASCTCCNPEPMIIYYSLYDDPALGKGSAECPNVGEPCPSGDGTESCANENVSGFLFSDIWDFIPLGKTPKAKIYAGASFDNWGNIGSAVSDNQGTNDCVLGTTYSDVIDTAILDGNKMKIAFSATNAQHGGPYGIISAVIEWYWE